MTFLNQVLADTYETRLELLSWKLTKSIGTIARILYFCGPVILIVLVSLIWDCSQCFAKDCQTAVSDSC